MENFEGRERTTGEKTVPSFLNIGPEVTEDEMAIDDEIVVNLKMLGCRINRSPKAKGSVDITPKSRGLLDIKSVELVSTKAGKLSPECVAEVASIEVPVVTDDHENTVDVVDSEMFDVGTVPDECEQSETVSKILESLYSEEECVDKNNPLESEHRSSTGMELDLSKSDTVKQDSIDVDATNDFSESETTTCEDRNSPLESENRSSTDMELDLSKSDTVKQDSIDVDATNDLSESETITCEDRNNPLESENRSRTDMELDLSKSNIVKQDIIDVDATNNLSESETTTYVDRNNPLEPENKSSADMELELSTNDTVKPDSIDVDRTNDLSESETTTVENECKRMQQSFAEPSVPSIGDVSEKNLNEEADKTSKDFEKEALSLDNFDKPISEEKLNGNYDLETNVEERQKNTCVIQEDASEENLDESKSKGIRDSISEVDIEEKVVEEISESEAEGKVIEEIFDSEAEENGPESVTVNKLKDEETEKSFECKPEEILIKAVGLDSDLEEKVVNEVLGNETEGKVNDDFDVEVKEKVVDEIEESDTETKVIDEVFGSECEENSEIMGSDVGEEGNEPKENSVLEESLEIVRKDVVEDIFEVELGGKDCNLHISREGGISEQETGDLKEVRNNEVKDEVEEKVMKENKNGDYSVSNNSAVESPEKENPLSELRLQVVESCDASQFFDSGQESDNDHEDSMLIDISVSDNTSTDNKSSAIEAVISERPDEPDESLKKSDTDSCTKHFPVDVHFSVSKDVTSPECKGDEVSEFVLDSLVSVVKDKIVDERTVPQHSLKRPAESDDSEEMHVAKKVALESETPEVLDEESGGGPDVTVSVDKSSPKAQLEVPDEVMDSLLEGIISDESEDSDEINNALEGISSESGSDRKTSDSDPMNAVIDAICSDEFGSSPEKTSDSEAIESVLEEICQEENEKSQKNEVKVISVDDDSSSDDNIDSVIQEICNEEEEETVDKKTENGSSDCGELSKLKGIRKTDYDDDDDEEKVARSVLQAVSNIVALQMDQLLRSEKIARMESLLSKNDKNGNKCKEGCDTGLLERYKKPSNDIKNILGHKDLKIKCDSDVLKNIAKSKLGKIGSKIERSCVKPDIIHIDITEDEKKEDSTPPASLRSEDEKSNTVLDTDKVPNKDEVCTDVKLRHELGGGDAGTATATSRVPPFLPSHMIQLSNENSSDSEKSSSSNVKINENVNSIIKSLSSPKTESNDVSDMDVDVAEAGKTCSDSKENRRRQQNSKLSSEDGSSDLPSSESKKVISDSEETSTSSEAMGYTLKVDKKMDAESSAAAGDSKNETMANGECSKHEKKTNLDINNCVEDGATPKKEYSDDDYIRVTDQDLSNFIRLQVYDHCRTKYAAQFEDFRQRLSQQREQLKDWIKYKDSIRIKVRDYATQQNATFRQHGHNPKIERRTVGVNVRITQQQSADSKAKTEPTIHTNPKAKPQATVAPTISPKNLNAILSKPGPAVTPSPLTYSKAQHGSNVQSSPVKVVVSPNGKVTSIRPVIGQPQVAGASTAKPSLPLSTSVVVLTNNTATTSSIHQFVDLTGDADFASIRPITTSTRTTGAMTVTPQSATKITGAGNVQVPLMSSLPSMVQLLPSGSTVTSPPDNVIRMIRPSSVVPQGARLAYFVPQSSGPVPVMPQLGNSPPRQVGNIQSQQPVIPGLRSPLSAVIFTPAPQVVNSTTTTATSVATRATSPAVVSTAMSNQVRSSQITLTPMFSEHPAPLPQPPTYPNIPKLKLLPPQPALKMNKVSHGIVLSWNMNLTSAHAEIATYQLYAYQENKGPVNPSLWKKVGDIKALPLPMACTLTQFVEGHTYHFSVRAVDVHKRLGNFSVPCSIKLLTRNLSDIKLEDQNKL